MKLLKLDDVQYRHLLKWVRLIYKLDIADREEHMYTLLYWSPKFKGVHAGTVDTSDLIWVNEHEET